MIPDGMYAVACPEAEGDFRLLWVRSSTPKDHFGARPPQPTAVAYRSPDSWVWFAFVEPDNTLRIHKKYLATWTTAQLRSVQASFALLAADPLSAQRLYSIVGPKYR